jgi:hypothetical protein
MPVTAVCARLCVGGGCGWVEHDDQVLRSVLGTLLGPEETPGWVVFLVAASGLIA